MKLLKAFLIVGIISPISGQARSPLVQKQAPASRLYCGHFGTTVSVKNGVECSTAPLGRSLKLTDFSFNHRNFYVKTANKIVPGKVEYTGDYVVSFNPKVPFSRDKKYVLVIKLDKINSGKSKSKRLSASWNKSEKKTVNFCFTGHEAINPENYANKKSRHCKK